MRKLKYSDALSEALMLAMEEDPKVFVMGEGVDDPKGIFGTTLQALKKFGPHRVFDTPLSESAMTGIGIGAAIEGNPCVMVHQRNEFLLLAMDQVINHAAKWRYMCGGTLAVPIVIRCLIGRGWGQAAQHSQSFHSLFGHVPGLKVIMPATAFDAKGLLYSAIRDQNPVICLEHRWLYGKEDSVPEGRYEIPIGQAKVVAPGKDITCVSVSHQLYDCLKAREALQSEGIELEVIDLRSIRPLDKESILRSVHKTGRLMVTDIGHQTFGVSAEIGCLVAEEAYSVLKAPVVRITLPDAPTPCSYVLEEVYYPKADDLVQAAKELMKGKRISARRSTTEETSTVTFSGPF